MNIKITTLQEDYKQKQHLLQVQLESKNDRITKLEVFPFPFSVSPPRNSASDICYRIRNSPENTAPSRESLLPISKIPLQNSLENSSRKFRPEIPSLEISSPSSLRYLPHEFSLFLYLLK